MYSTNIAQVNELGEQLTFIKLENVIKPLFSISEQADLFSISKDLHTLDV